MPFTYNYIPEVFEILRCEAAKLGFSCSVHFREDLGGYTIAVTDYRATPHIATPHIAIAHSDDIHIFSGTEPHELCAEVLDSIRLLALRPVVKREQRTISKMSILTSFQ